ncbi:formate dehydrogenase accessory sulfurtransferase FdhD [Aeromonas sp. MdU4]|uniref:formate dehydrogenase accessory sulfurtransferase FdhD n=1 Tax=Aeromonas sp. MdU4 TaxID=3342819 RepID=UPI0035BA930A
MPAASPAVIHHALPSLGHRVEEVTVSININGTNHAVMMATPHDLDDFAVGFLFCESIIGHNYDVHDIRISPAEHGLVLDVNIANRCLASPNQLAVRLALKYNLNVVHIPKFDAPVSYSSYRPADPIGECHESY